MSELHFPWLELSVFVPLLGAICVGRLRDADLGRKWCMVFAGFTLLLHDRRLAGLRAAQCRLGRRSWHLMTRLAGPRIVRRRSDQRTAVAAGRVALFSDGAGHAANQDPPLFVRLDVVLRGRHAGHVQLQRALERRRVACPGDASAVPGTARPRQIDARLCPPHGAVHFADGRRLRCSSIAKSGSQVHSLKAILPLLGAVLIRSGIAPFHMLDDRSVRARHVRHRSAIRHADRRRLRRHATGAADRPRLGAAQHGDHLAGHRRLRGRHVAGATRRPAFFLLFVPQPFGAGAGRLGNGDTASA